MARGLACCSLLLLTATTVTGSQWYPGNIHVHTTFSDGSDNVPQRASLAKKLGYRFLILTDHYEQIGSSDKVSLRYRVANPSKVDIGFGDYVRNCAEQTQDGSFVAIAGAEIQTIWHAEPDTTDASHTLALGSVGTVQDDGLVRLASSTDCQKQAIDWARGKGLLPVGAHPALISAKSVSLAPWEWQRNRYDRRSADRYAGVTGFEFFNAETSQQDRETLAWYLTLVKEELGKPQSQRRPLFVTAGCDSHGWKDPKDAERWLRVTYVLADILNEAGVIAALRDGRSYASAHGAYLKAMSYAPGVTTQTAGSPAFRFAVVLPVHLSPNIVMYRDGVEMPESRVTKQGPAGSINYEWTDKAATPGEHWYVLWVDGYLVTSPICLDVKNSQQPKPSIVFVIDRSGSISGARGVMQEIQLDAKEFASEIIRNAARAAVINFSGPGQCVVDIDFTNDADALKRAIESPGVMNGSTALYDAVVAAVGRARDSGETPMLIVLSDGKNNSSRASLEKAITTAMGSVNRPIPVIAVGYLGSDGRNDTDLRHLADRTHGFYRNSENLDVKQLLGGAAEYFKNKKTSGIEGQPE